MLSAWADGDLYVLDALWERSGLAEVVEITEAIGVCRDPKDDQVLGLAVCGRLGEARPRGTGGSSPQSSIQTR